MHQKFSASWKISKPTRCRNPRIISSIVKLQQVLDAGNCKVETRQRAKHIQVTFSGGLTKMGSREMGAKMDRAKGRTFWTGKIQGHTWTDDLVILDAWVPTQATVNSALAPSTSTPPHSLFSSNRPFCSTTFTRRDLDNQPESWDCRFFSKQAWNETEADPQFFYDISWGNQRTDLFFLNFCFKKSLS